VRLLFLPQEGKALSRQDSINVELKELAGVDQVVKEYGKYPDNKKSNFQRSKSKVAI
jgi:hypothetical protein